MEGDKPERRRHPRVPISVRVRIEYTGKEFSADSSNVSAGGMFVECSQKLPIGTKVLVRFTVPMIAKYPFHAEGEVVWAAKGEHSGLAIRFTDISEDDGALLAELADSQSLES